MLHKTINILIVAICVFQFQIFTQGDGTDPGLLTSESCGRHLIDSPNLSCTTRPDKYILFYQDEFDQESLQMSVWKFPDQRVIGVGNSGLEYLIVPELATLINGELNLKVDNNPRVGDMYSYSGPSINAEFGAGQLETKKEFGYGFYEVTAKVGEGKGIGSAFWSFSGNSVDSWYEIDCYEFWHSDNHPDQTEPQLNVHNGKNSTDKYHCAYYHDQNHSVDYAEVYTKFGYDWDPFYIKFYIGESFAHAQWKYSKRWGNTPLDCESVGDYNKVKKAANFPDTDGMNVFLTVGPEQAATTVSGAINTAHKIKYFRYWKREEVRPISTFSNLNSANIENNKFNVIAGTDLTFKDQFKLRAGNISVNGSFVDQNQWEDRGHELSVVASEKIQLLPGFEANHHSYFSAKMDPSISSDRSVSESKFPQPYALENVEDFHEDLPKHERELTSQKDAEKDFINSHPSPDQIVIYPAPAEDLIYLLLPLTDGEPIEMQISDSNGRILMEWKSDGSIRQNVNVSHLPSGVYFVKGVSQIKNKIYVDRFLKL